jgi:hypothetical protein
MHQERCRGEERHMHQERRRGQGRRGVLVGSQKVA